MARHRSRGFRPPADYDPRRGRKRNPTGASSTSTRSAEAKSTEAKPTGARQSQAPLASPTLPPLRTLPAPLAATITRPDDVAQLSFADLGLGGNIVRALAELGAQRPFAIQAATIPDAIAGHHVLARGRTGSGKTIAFAAAVVERLLRLKAEGAFPDEAPRARLQRGERQPRPERGAIRPPKALILAPTRELALQIDRTVQPIARSVGVYTGQFVGGQPFEPQLHALKRGVDIAIGTPGRIEDLARRGHLSLERVSITVIDEADHMADLGFIEPVQRLLRLTRRGSQRLLFSATLDSSVEALVAEFMPRPAVHEIREPDHGQSPHHSEAGAYARSGRETESDGAEGRVEHRVCVVLREHKDAALVELVQDTSRAIVFCRTRAYVDHVAELLSGAGVRAVPLHGDLSQSRRERNLEAFAAGRAQVLVATDIAARGIHVDDVDVVVQADPPDDAKSYVHRAGRTGRVGQGGRVVTVIPRTRQKRTRELFEQLGFAPDTFGDFVPAGAPAGPPTLSSDSH